MSRCIVGTIDRIVLIDEHPDLGNLVVLLVIGDSGDNFVAGLAVEILIDDILESTLEAEFGTIFTGGRKSAGIQIWDVPSRHVAVWRAICSCSVTKERKCSMA